MNAFLLICFIVSGFIYVSLLEYLIHRFIVHPLSKKQTNLATGHWYGHHRASRFQSMIDSDHSFLGVWFLLVATIVHVPIMFFHVYTIVLFVGMGIYACLAWSLHAMAHSRPGWARRYLPWHYDHHMGPNQDTNWCIVVPMWDALLCTRVRYARTALEIIDLARARRIVGRSNRRRQRKM